MPDPDGDEEFTELHSARFSRVDLVGAPANGSTSFLVMKQDAEAGLLEPGFVRDLIAKAEPDSGRERVQTPSGITVSGSPADIAAFIHKASVRATEAGPAGVVKGKYSAEDKRKMLAAGHAIKNENGDPAYPIGDKDDLGKAIHAVGRGGPDHDHIRAYVIRRAKALGASGEIPGNWAADGSLKEASVSKTAAVAKDMGPELDDGIDQLDPAVPLCAPEGDAPGDPTDPGSPAWEAIDAATACKWTSILARALKALEILAEREMLEAAAADPDDAENAWDLQDAACAIDYAIGILAPFAVSEQSEADCGADEIAAAIGKAMAGFDPAPIGTIEGLCAVAKSGRVLSAANETHIREAAARLTTVLSSLPQAPAADDGQPVAKMTPETEADMPKPSPAEDVTAASGQQPAMGAAEPAAREAVVTKAAGGEAVAKSALALVYDRDGNLAGVTDSAAIVTRVAKADDGEKKAMQAVFDQDGDLIGIVDPDAIQPVTGAGGKAPADDGDAAADAAPDASDMTPAPAAETGTPAGAVDDDGTVAKQDSTDVAAVLKSIVAEAVAAALGAQAPAQDVAKQADVAGLLEQVETLKARLVTVEEHPAAPKVFTNGQVPPAHQMRGQDQGASPVIDVAKAREMKQRMYTADPAEANRIATEMNRSAIAALEAIHSGARQ